MTARDLPINTLDSQLPVGTITIYSDLERLASVGMEFVISPVIVSEHGKKEGQVVGFTLRALGAEPASVHRAALIAPNHPVNREETTHLMADNQIVKEI